ncbi:glycerophosphodiester phosphodiesterase [Microbulbifer thermotolerans]|uniref:glycerophosphodiester phosphodiesterase n=1 Tax=Microbulbifer thermotolerans TaxID=252514 RepID=UPI0022487AA5|nr:glycerophosphodiester phosphodiesterase [Microbulbifer thermotolerans]MCX2793468.1 glycerophosphodiester phosphodiesterase [Microbulbifer thermotolerans]MCX2840652.1 glycerophosphodiester phosphodiesterase [Microbulbifer thermotolerans]
MFWLSLFCIALLILWLYARSHAAPSSALDLPKKKGPLVIAHGDERGRGLYPGNTLFYLKKMVALGVDALEIDLNLTADGHLVLIHDSRLERTSDGRGAVGASTLEELRQLNMGYNWSQDGEVYPYRDQPLRIATIDEAFAALPDTPMIIELKNNDRRAAEAMCESLRRSGKGSQVIVSSFHQGVIRHFRRLCPEVATGATRLEAMGFFVAQLLHAESLLRPAYQTMQLPMRYWGIPVFSPRLMRAARKLKLHMSAWTVNEEADMRRYIDLGLDGLVTDRPDQLMALLKRKPG